MLGVFFFYPLLFVASYRITSRHITTRTRPNRYPAYSALFLVLSFFYCCDDTRHDFTSRHRAPRIPAPPHRSATDTPPAARAKPPAGPKGVDVSRSSSARFWKAGATRHRGALRGEGRACLRSPPALWPACRALAAGRCRCVCLRGGGGLWGTHVMRDRGRTTI